MSGFGPGVSVSAAIERSKARGGGIVVLRSEEIDTRTVQNEERDPVQEAS